MEYLTIFIIALGLSADSFAVSISCGLLKQHIKFWQAVPIAFSLAFFQGLLPLAGWFLGYSLAELITDYDHWIAFALLAFLGIKMIYESSRKDEDKEEKIGLGFWQVITMSVATSIDALIVGASFGFIDSGFILMSIAVLIIGAVTFIVSMLGILFGKKAGMRFGKTMELAGGLVLILIGAKILIEHLFF